MFEDWENQTAHVERYEGTSGDGDMFLGSNPVLCQIEDTNQLLIDGAGESTQAKSILRTRRSNLGKFNLGSRVTLPNGAVCRVLVIKDHLADDEDLNSVEVFLG